MPDRPDAAPLVLSVFATFGVGGPQVRFARIANHFGRRFRHAIIAMDGCTDCAALLGDGLDIVWPEVDHRKGDLLGNVRRFRRVLRDVRPSVLVTSNWGSIEWAIARLAGRTRHVHLEDGFGPDEVNRQAPRRVWARRLVLRRSIVVLPSLTLFRIATEIWRLPRRRLRHIPNGIDLARFTPTGPRMPQQSFVSGDVPTIGTVATLRPEKNVPRLLHALARLAAAGQPFRAVVVGDGSERGSLERLSDQLGLSGRVSFVGSASKTEDHYSRFDVFALSSDTEQMPLSVIEAMASGLPVVATDVGDVRSMISAENRPFVVPRDDKALSEALRGLLAQPGELVRIGTRNRVKAEAEFDERTMFDRYAEVFAAPSRPR
jgi:glycosyltransferase involved in cell wall biosynthesis